MFALLDAPAAAVPRRVAARAEPGAAAVRFEQVSFSYPARSDPCSTGSISSCARERRSRWSARAGRQEHASPRCCSACSSPPAGASASAASTSLVPDRRLAAADRLGAPASDAAARHDRRQHPAREPARPIGSCATRPPAPGDGSSARCRTATRPSSATGAGPLPGERRRIGLARRSSGRPARDPRRADRRPRPPQRRGRGRRRAAAAAGRTVLLIAHRPELIESADRIVRLTDGIAVAEPSARRRERDAPPLLRLVSVPRGASPRRGARRADDPVRRRADGHVRLSDLTRRRAPPILSLMVAIAAVQAFGIARPIARYLERLASHDLALRSLGRLRTRFYERIEPLAPRSSRLSQGRPARAHGRRRRRAAEPLPARPAAADRALLAGAVAVGAAAAFLPPRASCSPWASSRRARRPVLSGLVGARAGRRQAAARGALSAELVELLGAAPELVAFGDRRAARSASAPRTRRSSGWRGATRSPPARRRRGHARHGRHGRRRARRRGRPAAQGDLDHVLIAMLALLALAAFEAVTPARGRGPRAVRDARGRPSAARAHRARARGARAHAPGAAAALAIRRRAGRRARPLPAAATPGPERMSLRLEPGERSRSSGPAAPGRPPSRTCCSASSIPRRAG